MDIIYRNHVKRFGNGKQTIVFAAGFGCDQNMWRYVTPAFEDRYQIVLFDYVGAGKSDISAYDPERYSNLQGYAEDVLEVLEYLNLEDVIFIGHSLSSMIGLLASIQQPNRFAKLIMVGPSPCYINDGDYVGGFDREALEGLFELMENNYFGWAHTLAPVVMKNEERPELSTELEESFCSTDPVIAKNFARATFFADNRKDLAKATVPSLIMQCAEDTLAPNEVGDYLHKHMPLSEIVHMKATGHCPHMSHPEETIEIITHYLSKKGHARRLN